MSTLLGVEKILADIDVPVIHAAENVRIYWWIAGALAALMAAGLLAWYARARKRRAFAAPSSRAQVSTRTEALAREIASLDAAFERAGAADAAARAAYEERRRALKRELASALDATALDASAHSA